MIPKKFFCASLKLDGVMSREPKGIAQPVKWLILPCLLLSLTLLPPLHGEEKKVSVASIGAKDLTDFETQPESVRKLIESSLSLTTKKLGYQFGSNSPEKGGMDCSGTVQFALQKAGLDDVPRSSWDLYKWAEAAGTLIKTPGATSTIDPVFKDLHPGDLLFWEGTYETGKRSPAISHVMIYLGTLESDGNGVVFGASSGRRYRGKSIHGVSVFDWTVPKPDSKSKFVGYARIPGLIPPKTAEKPSKEKKSPQKSTLDVLIKKSETSPP